MKIAVCSSTRADWGLLSPLCAELRRRGADVGVIASNMHFLAAGGNTIEEIRADGFEPIASIPPGEDAAATMSRQLDATFRALTEFAPECVVILGDRYEMLGAASAAVLARVPIVHIAGGTISEGAFDDSFRHAISKLATLHFPETEACAARLVRMGEDPSRVITAGAIGVYNLGSVRLMTKDELEASIGWELRSPVVLATLHAATLAPESPEDQMQALLDALASRPDLRVLLTHPNNDVDPVPLVARMEAFAAANPDRVRIVPSLGRLRYLSALKYVDAVVGNSSSGLVEVPSAGIPTLDIGIRQKGREAGRSVVHCGGSAAEISAGLDAVLSDEMRRIARTSDNPYARPDTLSVMAGAILNSPFSPTALKPFYSN